MKALLMGRKSAAKAQSRVAGSAASTTPPPKRSRSIPLLMIVAIVIAAAVVVTGYLRGGRASDQLSPSAAARAPQAPVEPPAAAERGPHPQQNLPPLPFDPAPARPMDVVRSAYLFAAEHPDVLSYVPCYCGCERSGHRGNEDCFVTRRDEHDDVVEWEPHGMT
jgi:hypothetical protein